MEVRDGDLLEVVSGVICQQVNCANGYGAGLSGKIAAKYPQVERAYRDIFKTKSREEIFGLCQPVRVSEALVVVNIFAEWDYANAYETGIVSTHMNKLCDGLHRICEKFAGKDMEIYVPYKIGCGLAGGDWDELCKRCVDLPIIALRPRWAK